MAVIDPFKIKVNDLQPFYYAQVKDNTGTVIDITDATIVCSMKNIDTGALKINRYSLNSAWISDPTNGKFHYRWQSGDTDTAGTYYIEFEITPASGSGKFTVPPDNSAVIIVKGSLDTT